MRSFSANPAPEGPATRIARFLTYVSRTGARIVPLGLANAVAEPVADAVRVLTPAHRSQLRRNYAVVLGRPEDDPVVERAVRACYHHFGRYVAEVIHAQGWSTEDVLDRVDVEGAEHLREAADMGRGVIFVSGHIGSTETAASLAVLHGFRVTSLAERIRPAWLMDYLVASRERMGITLLPVTGAGISLIRVLRRGGMAAMVVDAGVEGVGSLPVSFCGRRTQFPEGPARLARMTGAPVVFGMAARLPRGRFRAHVCEPLLADRSLSADESIARLTQQIATTLEQYIRRYPGQWYAFRDIWGLRRPLPI